MILIPCNAMIIISKAMSHSCATISISYCDSTKEYSCRRRRNRFGYQQWHSNPQKKMSHLKQNPLFIYDLKKSYDVCFSVSIAESTTEMTSLSASIGRNPPLAEETCNALGCERTRRLPSLPVAQRNTVHR
jgi:hypothetical protein